MAEASDTSTVVVERDLSHAPEKVWRALTQPHLLAEWLMSTDFLPEAGHPFVFSADWGQIACRVEEVDPNRVLSYRWDALGLESVVTWTLVPSGAGTLLRMEQVGFRTDQKQARAGALVGWRRFFDNLDRVLGGIE